MATLSSTNISSTISANGETPISFTQSGLIMEVFRVQLGAVGDTIAITPQYITNIRTVQSGGAAFSHNVAATSTNTNVTLTLTASAATTTTADVQLIGRR